MKKDSVAGVQTVKQAGVDKPNPVEQGAPKDYTEIFEPDPVLPVPWVRALIT